MYNLPVINNELNKGQLSVIASITANEMQNSNILDAIDVMSKMEFLIKEIKSNKEFIESARNEVEKWGKEYKSSTGTKIELAEVGTKYDYINCNDVQLNKLLTDQEFIEFQIKERQTFLKSLPTEGLETITSEGEVIKLFPPTKTSTSSIKTTLPR